MRNIVMSHESDEREEFKPVEVDGKARVVSRTTANRTPHWKEGKGKKVEAFKLVHISHKDDTIKNIASLVNKEYEDPDVTSVYVNKVLWSRADIACHNRIDNFLRKQEESKRDKEAVNELLEESRV